LAWLVDQSKTLVTLHNQVSLKKLRSMRASEMGIKPCAMYRATTFAGDGAMINEKNAPTRLACLGRTMGISLIVAASIVTTAAAHHSYSAFDMSKLVEVRGAVREFRWTNPHSWLVVTTRDASGNVQDVRLELNGPGYLVRQGWKRESLKLGDAITVSMNPMYDGSSGGNVVKVTLPDGRVLSAMPSRLLINPGDQK
jgi:hypothetical protein